MKSVGKISMEKLNDKLNNEEFFFVLNRLYNKIPCGLVWYTPDLNSEFRFINDIGISLLGYSSKKELINKGGIYLKNYIHPEDYPKILATHKKIRHLGDHQKVQFRALGNNDEIKIFEGVITLEKAFSGKTLFHFAFSDITSVKQIEEEFLYKSNELSALIENIPGGVCAIQLRNSPKVIYSSEQIYNLFGIDKPSIKKMIQEDFFSIFHPEDVDVAKTIINDIKKNKSQQDVTLRIIHKKDKYKYVNFRASVIGNVDSEIIIFVILLDVDEQKETEANLLSQKQLVNLVLNQSDVMLWVYDIKNSKCSVKPFIEGLQEKGTLFKDIKNFPESYIQKKYVDESSAEVFRNMCERLKSGEPKVQEICAFPNDNGTGLQWRKIHYLNFYDEDGNPSHAIGCAINVTEMVTLEKRYDDELTYRREVNTEHLVEFLSANLTKDMIVEHQLYTPFLSFKNSSFSKFIAYCTDQISYSQEKEKFKSIFSPHNMIDAYNLGESNFHFECKIHSPTHNMNLSWLNIYCRLALEPTTRDVIAFLYIYDISEKKAAETIVQRISSVEYDFLNIINIKSQEAETQYKKENIVPNVPGLGKLKPYNSTVEQILNLYVKEVASEQELESLYTKLELSTIIKELETQEKYAVSFPVKEKDGVIHRKKWQYMYLDNDKQQIIHSQSDVTDVYEEEIRQKEMLKDALIAAEQANKAKTEFLSRMSHEIRTPMNAIIGMSELAQQSVHNTELVIDSISKVSSSAKFLLNLINDILDMSRIESGRTVLSSDIINFSSFIENINIICEAQAKQKHVNFISKINGNISNSFMGDKTKLQQILINIISNGIKFTPSGGSVVFSITQKEIVNNQGLLEFIIKDDGIGISPNFINHLFEPFTQEHTGSTSLYGGTGLGLAISKNFISLMGGTIDVESKPGFGTKFIITLKLTVAKEDIEATSPQEKNYAAISSREFDFTGKRVLLVEDHALNIEVAKKLLISRNLDVDVAENGVLAVDIIEKATQNYYDAILMDIRMPVMDGITATKTIRELPTEWTKKVPIIAMTANAFEEDIEKTKNAGMNAHLSKPIEPNILFSTLAKFIL